MQEYVPSLSPSDIRNVQRSYELAREHLGGDIDIIVHCHCELDLPSAIAVAKAVESIKPIYYEDPLQPGFSGNWLALRRATTLPIMTGENLELPEQALMSGGITGTKRIADLAALHRMPVTLHNVSGMLFNAASQQLGAAIFNCPRMHTGRRQHHVVVAQPARHQRRPDEDILQAGPGHRRRPRLDGRACLARRRWMGLSEPLSLLE